MFWKNYKHPIIALLIAVLIKLFLPAGNGLTEIGVNVLALFVSLIYCFMTIGTDWVSLLFIGLVCITGVMTPAQVIAGSLGSPVIPLAIAVMIIAKLLTDTGVMSYLAKWFITRKIVKGRPYVFFAMFGLSFILLGCFMNVLSLIIVYLSLAEEVCKGLGYKRSDKFYHSLMMCILWGNISCIMSTPIGRTPPLIVLGGLEAVGISVGFGQYMIAGIPYAILSGLLIVLLIKVMIKPDLSLYNNYDVDAMRANMGQLSKSGKIVFWTFVVLVISWVFPDFGSGILPGVAAFLKTQGAQFTTIIAVAFLLVINYISIFWRVLLSLEL